MQYSKQNERVELRAMEPEDLDFLYQIENDIALWDVGITNVPYSRYALYNYLAECKNDIYSDKQLRLMITTVDHGCVGIVDLVNFDPKHLRAELGIVIQKPYRGKGYGRAAVLKMLQYARDVIHLNQVYAVISADNAQSLKLFEEVGFTEGAVLKQWLYHNGVWQTAKLLHFFYKKKGEDCLVI